jgi:hypothetical protein
MPAFSGVHSNMRFSSKDFHASVVEDSHDNSDTPKIGSRRMKYFALLESGVIKLA